MIHSSLVSTIVESSWLVSRYSGTHAFIPDDSNGRTTCDPEMIRELEEHLVHGEEEHDPRWDELERLTTNN